MSMTDLLGREECLWAELNVRQLSEDGWHAICRSLGRPGQTCARRTGVSVGMAEGRFMEVPLRRVVARTLGGILAPERRIKGVNLSAGRGRGNVLIGEVHR